ncbi:bacterial Ig-like domain-containing protein [Mobilitalea sibirica]|uniref:Bacterial Ig-like domain-containing protein n=1 Tax=Mobilitalea sibirica TaxID=1462919 RepID=A0A8J7H7J4_9FIRM|nr:bacterial Ig-like domain-containing protein [Mobilitalea sibirica]MBH1939485.1 bacterial Ig-like domain-containing protein [Mobilitalea sibirica]
MKKKILTLLVILIAATSLSGLLDKTNVKAEDSPVLVYAEITQYPNKTTYMAGESLDFSDMIWMGYFADGTTENITDYKIEGFDTNKIGLQTVFIKYQDYMIGLNVTVLPGKIKNIHMKGNSISHLTLSWDEMDGIQQYEIYRWDETSGDFILDGSSYTNQYTSYAPAGTILKYQIRAVGEIYGSEYKGVFSDTFTGAIKPLPVTGLEVTDTTSTSISLTWDKSTDASGYLIYRSQDASDSYEKIGTTQDISYIDKTALSGTGFRYKVSAYSFDPLFAGDYSTPVEITTNPAKMKLKVKVGEQKVRLSWPRVTGATSYDIYWKDSNSEFSLYTTTKEDINSIIIEGLILGEAYSFYGIVHRDYNGIVYDSPVSDIVQAEIVEVEATSSAAALFSDVTEFENSSAYKDIEFFRNNAIFNESIIIPGLITTNVGGFSSTSMCPQGMTFTEDYLLISAYDLADEEYSVVYVLNKATKELLATIVLPVMAHVGGITYDGNHVWIAVGTSVSPVPIADIHNAVKEEKAYSRIDLNTMIDLGITASYMTFYNEMLWVGSYNELKSTRMYSYVITEDEDLLTLTKVNTVTMPTRVQGLAFTENGYLILSRSCQLYKGLRGYMRQLDLYQPDFADQTEGIISLGDIVHTVEMPSMNEEIAIEDSYLYVNFESAAFDNASYQVDRVIAFDLTSILPAEQEFEDNESIDD